MFCLSLVAKDRPRPRREMGRPVRRTGDGLSPDNSSDGGLDNDDNGTGEVLTTPTIEPVNPPSVPTIDSPITQLPPK